MYHVILWVSQERISLFLGPGRIGRRFGCGRMTRVEGELRFKRRRVQLTKSRDLGGGMNREEIEERVEAARVGDIVGIVKGQSHPIPIPSRSDRGIGDELKASDDMVVVSICPRRRAPSDATPASVGCSDIPLAEGCGMLGALFPVTQIPRARGPRIPKAGAEPNRAPTHGVGTLSDQ